METSVWTNIELLGAGGPAVRAEQVEIEWPRMSYIQRLLTWLRARFARIVGRETPAAPAAEEKTPEFGSVAKEYMCDTHDVHVAAEPHI
jgi:hypothetical protein